MPPDVRRCQSLGVVEPAGRRLGRIIRCPRRPSPPMTLDTISKLGPIATGVAAIVALIVGSPPLRRRAGRIGGISGGRAHIGRLSTDGRQATQADAPGRSSVASAFRGGGRSGEASPRDRSAVREGVPGVARACGAWPASRGNPGSRLTSWLRRSLLRRMPAANRCNAAADTVMSGDEMAALQAQGL